MTKAEKEFIETIQELRLRTLVGLKMHVKKISGLVDDLSKKIDQQGTKTRYSVNSDIRRAGEMVWSHEMRLSELGKIEEDFKMEIQKRLKRKRELAEKKSRDERDN